MTQVSRRSRRRLMATTSVAAAAVLLAACSSGSAGGSSSTTAASQLSFLVNTENTTIPAVLTTLSTGACATANTALPLKVDTVPQTNLDQQLQLLAGQNSLPVSFAAGNSAALTKQLDTAGQLVNFEKTLTDLGVIDDIQPAAIATIKSLYGGNFNVLPYQYNVEGIWYNKKLFADNGIQVPTTWSDLTAAAAKLQATGINAFSASGQQGWPITRLVSGYLFRSLGSDAMSKVMDGSAKLTDPEYVAAAQAIADLGAAGYFGQGVGSIDYDTAISQFSTGKAAMLYMGSWVLSNFADKAATTIGEDNIGFMPFPAVEGGKGSIDQIPANVGLAMTFGAKSYSAPVGDWLKCIAENYGTTALNSQNSISGFKTKQDVTNTDPLVKTTQETISNLKDPILWFEALMGPKAKTASETNAAPLLSGSLSAADFMKTVQDAIDSEK